MRTNHVFYILKTPSALPVPMNISFMWNFGSLLGTLLTIQIGSGLFLAMHYSNNMESAFFSVIHITRDVNFGWLIRSIHANGATLFFIGLYLHMGRGLYYKSFMSHPETWLSGCSILLLSMAIAFLGYVLPWGQMSFWGATVITNLLSAIPYLGEYLVNWLWGGFSVSSPTLSRFFTLHFMVPFILLGTVVGHLMFLHSSGSSNPIGSNSKIGKIEFSPYFYWKDLVTLSLLMLLPGFTLLKFPYLFMDSENFMWANPLITPVHIQPEWYYLFAYAILRSVPNKLGGVILLVLAVLIFYTLPFIKHSKPVNFLSQIYFWWFTTIFIMLTWVGANPVEIPFISFGQTLTTLYFLYLVL